MHQRGDAGYPDEDGGLVAIMVAAMEIMAAKKQMAACTTMVSAPCVEQFMT